MGEIRFDGTNVTIAKKARGQVTFPVQSVQSVTIAPAGIGMAGIRFAIAGGTLAGPSKALGSHRDLAADPYALTFRKKRTADFEALLAQVEETRRGLLT